VDVAVFVPFTCLHEVARMAEDSAVIAGAQNFYYEDSGAFTGEVSAPMLLDLGAKPSSWATRSGARSRRDDGWSPARRSARWGGLLPSSASVRPRRSASLRGGMWEKVSGQVGSVIERDLLDHAPTCPETFPHAVRGRLALLWSTDATRAADRPNARSFAGRPHSSVSPKISRRSECPR
jgi:hypothetical protein